MCIRDRYMGTNTDINTGDVSGKAECSVCLNIRTLIKSNDLRLCTACFEDKFKVHFSIRRERKALNPEIDHIVDNIYLGNEDTGLDKDVLLAKGITHVLVAGKNLVAKFPETFTYHKIDIYDSLDQDLFPYFEDCFEFIDRAERIYVHCAAGVSRSPSIVIGYLMTRKNLSFEEALELVRSKRWIVDPNSNFVSQLKKLSSLSGESPLRLKTN
eukprot:TRINITY_DN14221_c0_g1_i1.p1 TRINITY_DN14221_c0_g1~~TRINITY_DN14221_c0_g1_i1.p1  ORF type:complete len:213 (+),score=26.57 TRINITY_DN14221_c0_g1_i1:64-702(+)